MEMADYSEALDPAYTTLEFENMQVLAMSTGESSSQLNFESSELISVSECLVKCGMMRFNEFHTLLQTFEDDSRCAVCLQWLILNAPQ